MSTTNRNPRYSGLRALTGPALLLAAPAQYLGSASLLQHYGHRPLGVIGGIALVLLFTSTLTLIGGLGETGNLLVEFFRGSRES